MMISLVGGPLDGARMDWAGGDIFSAFDRPPLSLVVTDGERKPEAPREAAMYRRSLVTNTIFVFQP